MRFKLIILIFIMILGPFSNYVWSQPDIRLNEEALDHKVEVLPASEVFDFIVFGDRRRRYRMA